jgi:hypothetical protein
MLDNFIIVLFQSKIVGSFDLHFKIQLKLQTIDISFYFFYFTDIVRHQLVAH